MNLIPDENGVGSSEPGLLLSLSGTLSSPAPGAKSVPPSPLTIIYKKFVFPKYLFVCIILLIYHLWRSLHDLAISAQLPRNKGICW
jgi:hypothetical protein